MSPVLAHLVGANGLPLPRWLLAYLIGFLVLLVVAWLRAASPKRRWPPVETRTATDAPPEHSLVARVIGVVAFAGILAIGALTSEDSGGFVAVTVISMFWIGGLTIAPFVGDWFAPFNPFPTLARLVPDSEPLDAEALPAGTAAGFVFAFVWFWLVYAERFPNDHEITVFLGLYTLAVLFGAWWWGRAWVRGGEGFSATFALVGAIAPIGRDVTTGKLRLRAPLRGVAERGAARGTAALASALLGGVAYDGLSQTSWWTDDIAFGRTGLELKLVATAGLLCTTVLVMVIILGACRVATRLVDRDDIGLPEVLGGAVAVLAAGAWIAHELPQLIIDVQNFVALASDPLSRGDDIFGTIDDLPDPTLISLSTQAWISMIAMAVAAAGAAVLTVEAAFATFAPKRAARAVWPLAAATTVLAAGASMLLVGT